MVKECLYFNWFPSWMFAFIMWQNGGTGVFLANRFHDVL